MPGLKNRVRFFTLVAAFLLLVNGCAHRGLVSETYDPDFYEVPELLPEELTGEDVTFIVYGDAQAGYRVTAVFWEGRSWTSWKMLIFPFYQLYLLGNGIIGGINGLRRVTDYGGRERRMVREAVYEETRRSRAAFILNVGDMAAHDGRRPAHWELFLRENRVECPLLDEIAYLPVIGNHEHANDTTFGLKNYRSIFKCPGFYTVEAGNLEVFVLNSGYIIDQYEDLDDGVQDELFTRWFVSADGDSQPSWLEKELAGCEKKFKIVAMHHGPLSYGKHYRDWLDPDNGRDSRRKRQELIRLFQAHGVQAVFSGHDHLYQHNVLRYGQDQQMHFLIGGGGGGPLHHPLDAGTQEEVQEILRQDGFDVLSLVQESVHHYWLVRVLDENISIRVLAVTGQKDAPTRLIEEVRITD